MIPREILKNIRQIELRTNRIVTATLANAMNTKNRMINREIHKIRERRFGNHLSAYFAWFAVENYFPDCPTMIPREILKKIRQIELRTNRIVTESAAGARASARFTVCTTAASKTTPALNSIRPLKRRERRAPIPKGLCPPAQGCEERATLGNVCLESQPQRGCVRPRSLAATPLALWDFFRFTQCSSFLATLGFGPESLWDSLNLRPQPRSAYFRRSANRFSISAKTSSIGLPRPGFFSASSARRSSSSICSGVSSGSYPFSTMLLQTCCASSSRSARLNLASTSAFKVFHGNFPFGIGGAFQSWKPSMNSSQRRCASSSRSSNGSFFAAAKNVFTDMDLIYCVDSFAQAEFFRIAHHASRHP